MRSTRPVGCTLPLRARGADPGAAPVCARRERARERLLLSTRRAEEAGGARRSCHPRSSAWLPPRSPDGALDAERDRHARLRLLPVPARRARRRGEPDRALTLDERDSALLELDQALGRCSAAASCAPVAGAPTRSDARAGRPRRSRRSTVSSRMPRRSRRSARGSSDVLLSPTALETYAECPYRYFLARLLGSSQLDEPETIIAARRTHSRQSDPRGARGVPRGADRRRRFGPEAPRSARASACADRQRSARQGGRRGPHRDAVHLETRADRRSSTISALARTGDRRAQAPSRAGVRGRFGAPGPAGRGPLSTEEPFELAVGGTRSGSAAASTASNGTPAKHFRSSTTRPGAMGRRAV